MHFHYDIIVIGAGHAGCEAAHIAATLGSKVLLITSNMNTIAQMSCNPAMGGVAKGQIIREIDALGGLSGIITDETMIQFRMLNRSKGPAMWSPRAQSDRVQFSLLWRQKLEENPNVFFWQDTVTSLLISKGRVNGVQTSMGAEFFSASVILTTGTFMNGRIHVGLNQFSGGRMGEKATTGITTQLHSLGFTSGRMKTGTPPRVDGRSLDYSKMEPQSGDTEPSRFSFLHTTPLHDQLNCHITYTNDEVHEILRKGFSESPMFTGNIKGLGPRYCPSIEDKINRFAERNRHQIFVEPEGRNTVEVYVNGFSTSLPMEIQYEAIKKIPGFEKARLFRPGYAIEYDFFHPTQLLPTLETKLITGLFFAGQINGTTGYEEAASQGLMAGLNAHLMHNQSDPIVLSRSDAYIGVLIDDLTTKGTEEPYRMFTSRAEYRISLRQDNADLRLTHRYSQLPSISSERKKLVEEKINQSNLLRDFLEHTKVLPSEVNSVLESSSTSPITEPQKFISLIARPQVTLHSFVHVHSLAQFLHHNQIVRQDIIDNVNIEIKYASYIEKEKSQAEKLQTMENFSFPPTFDFFSLSALSMEAREKLHSLRPSTLGQASRISGISPADLSVLLVHFGR